MDFGGKHTLCGRPRFEVCQSRLSDQAIDASIFLDAVLDEMGMKQNRSKAESLATFAGPGSLKCLRQVSIVNAHNIKTMSAIVVRSYTGTASHFL